MIISEIIVQALAWCCATITGCTVHSVLMITFTIGFLLKLPIVLILPLHFTYLLHLRYILVKHNFCWSQHLSSFFPTKYYRVSQQVLNRLNVTFWSSEVCNQEIRSFRKNVFHSKKLLFKPFLWTDKIKMEFLSNFSQNVFCSNLFNKLFEIGEKLLKSPFSILVVQE